jgi:hypothetical protein
VCLQWDTSRRNIFPNLILYNVSLFHPSSLLCSIDSVFLPYMGLRATENFWAGEAHQSQAESQGIDYSFGSTQNHSLLP